MGACRFQAPNTMSNTQASSTPREAKAPPSAAFSASERSPTSAAASRTPSAPNRRPRGEEGTQRSAGTALQSKPSPARPIAAPATISLGMLVGASSTWTGMVVEEGQ